jgi:tRNA dimethylallyltransferase
VDRGLDVGTAKPSAEARARVRHHLVDIIQVSEPYSAGRFVRDAAAGTFFVGGTFLYYKALAYGMFQQETPPRRDELEAIPTPELAEALRREDPAAAARIHPHDRKRILRALEVVRGTGRSITALQTQWSNPADVAAVAIVRSRDELRTRIGSRVRRMFREGLHDEARTILNRPVSREVARAIGYREAAAHLRGELTQDRAIEETIRRTWVFCRKQLAWIRSLKELQVVDVTGITRAAEIASRVLERLA